MRNYPYREEFEQQGISFLCIHWDRKHADTYVDNGSDNENWVKWSCNLPDSMTCISPDKIPFEE